MSEFEERVRQLREEIEEVAGPGLLIAAWVVCNGCERRARIMSDEDLEGWHLGGHGEGTDLCPDCYAKGRGFG